MDDFQTQNFKDSSSEFAEANNAETIESIENQEKAFPNKPLAGNHDLPVKTVMWSLAVLGCISLVFGGLRWFTSLRIPFALEGEVVQANVNSNTNQTVSLLELKQKDTDGDGLDDYNELYLYETSPYLPDTDSDGVPDGTEIANSTNPNCPTGQDCTLAVPASQQTVVSLPDSADNLTTEQLRGLLLQAGLTQEEVNAVDDATLTDLYNQVLREKSATIADVNTEDNLEDLQLNQEAPDYSAADIRQLLKDQGVTNEELSNISDTELLQGWQELIIQGSAGQLPETFN